MGPVLLQVSGLPAYTGRLVSVATRSMMSSGRSQVAWPRSYLPAKHACPFMVTLTVLQHADLLFLN